MNRQRWLQQEITDWVRDGLIDQDQAVHLIQRYQVGTGRGWGQVIFAALGALIFGLGVILLIAYNWADMHRYLKLAVVFASIIVAHAAGRWLDRQGQSQLAESLNLLGTMLFGAGIWLVAQIYHIDEHYPNGFLLWCFGALTLAWALPSVAQGMLAAGLVLVWNYSEVFDFHRTLHWSPWLIAIGLVPLAWLERSRALLGFALVVFVLQYEFIVVRLDDDLFWSTLGLISASLYGGALLAPQSAFPSSAGVLRVLGSGGLLIFLFAGSFLGVVEELRYRGDFDALSSVYAGLPVLVCGLVFVALVSKSACWPRDVGGRIELALVGLVAAMAIVLLLGARVDLLLWALCNLAVLTLAGLRIHRGVKLRQGGQVALGCVLISALVFARFNDLFESLLIRSMAFLLLGVTLFVIGVISARRPPAGVVDA